MSNERDQNNTASERGEVKQPDENREAPTEQSGDETPVSQGEPSTEDEQ